MSLRRLIAPEVRRRALKDLLAAGAFVRFMEAHSGLSAIIADGARVEGIGEFDGIWVSSFTETASKGLPDIEMGGFEGRLRTIEEILSGTAKPLLVDGDTGGEASHFEYLCATLERRGVSAVVIEDKLHPKRNSLDADSRQDLEDPRVFASKIKRGKGVLLSEDFLIIARIESLMVGTGMDDALARARTYLEAGVDGILIHSRKSDPGEVFAFADRYAALCAETGFRAPLACVPTTYNRTTEDELAGHGFRIAVHANHLLRASCLAMQKAARVILEHGRSFEAEPLCSPVSEVFGLVGHEDVKERDRAFSPANLKAIIPAAGIPNQGIQAAFGGVPVSAIRLKESTILERQIETLRMLGVSDVTVVTGYRAELFTGGAYSTVHNPEFDKTYILRSLFQAEAKMGQAFLMVYSDILFDEGLVRDLLRSRRDILLVLDSSVLERSERIAKPGLELAVTRARADSHYRVLRPADANEVAEIGCAIRADRASHEFVGIAFFSARGAEILRNVYADCRHLFRGRRFHEADSFDRASFTDIVAEIIERGFPVHAFETSRGWHEIQCEADYLHALSQV